MALLDVKDLSIHFGGVKAVQNVSFSIDAGIVYAVIGPNGAGKTTTMKMLTQYISPDHGTIWYGSSSSRDAIELRRSIGYLPEHNPLYEDMPMLDYLAFCAALQGVPQGEIQNNIRNMVKKCGLKKRLFLVHTFYRK
jgi:ABC-2 type transport system ATP-binding protein